MPSSFRQINYSLRPAKAIERRMLSEMFRRLHPFQRIETYRYVGFGSIYFSDFMLFHRDLGIENMLSLERDTNAKMCFEFNKPYAAIKLQFGESELLLPTLDWTTRSIVWLDYDRKLTTSVLGDIGTFCNQASSGSVLVVSVNAQAEPEPNEKEKKSFEQSTGKPFDSSQYRLSKLEEFIPDRVPMGTDGKSLRKNGVAEVFHKVIISEIETVLSGRNTLVPTGEKMRWEQFAHFRYCDGALMLTVGIVLYSEAEAATYQMCAFDQLNLSKNGVEAYEIQVPSLTSREINHLNSQLPQIATGKTLKCEGVADGDIQIYSEIYRYFPNYNEVLWT
jgi:hypothetical protein